MGDKWCIAENPIAAVDAFFLLILSLILSVAEISRIAWEAVYAPLLLLWLRFFSSGTHHQAGTRALPGGGTLFGGSDLYKLCNREHNKEQYAYTRQHSPHYVSSTLEI